MRRCPTSRATDLGTVGLGGLGWGSVLSGRAHDTVEIDLGQARPLRSVRPYRHGGLVGGKFRVYPHDSGQAPIVQLDLAAVCHAPVEMPKTHCHASRITPRALFVSFSPNRHPGAPGLLISGACRTPETWRFSHFGRYRFATMEPR